AEIAGVLSSLAQCHRVPQQIFEVKSESVRPQLRLRYNPSGSGLSKGSGVRSLVIVGGVRVRDENSGPADSTELGYRRGAGAANCQMRARQAFRNVGKEALKLHLDAIFPVD